MTLDEYIITCNIRPADAIVVKKVFPGLLDHYLIYLGKVYGEHKFIANYAKGVKILTNEELRSYSTQLEINRIKRFSGNEIQRETAVQRALSRIDQDSYSLLLNNCEHYANYVQYGMDYSKQTKVFGIGLAAVGLTTALNSKNNASKEAAGWLMTGLGILTLLLDDKK